MLQRRAKTGGMNFDIENNFYEAYYRTQYGDLQA
jgi:hypothetical protein